VRVRVRARKVVHSPGQRYLAPLEAVIVTFGQLRGARKGAQQGAAM